MFIRVFALAVTIVFVGLAANSTNIAYEERVQPSIPLVLAMNESTAGGDAKPEPDDPLNLPLADWKNFRYAGGFRLPADIQKVDGVEFRYAGNRGSIAVSADRSKMFVGAFLRADNNGKPGWSQIEIPAINPETDFGDMPVATSVQGAAAVWHKVSRPDGPKNRSMHSIEYKGMLVGTMVHNYDAGRAQKFFVWRVDDAKNLATSSVGGLYELEGAYHAAGWIVEVPDEWKELVGYDHLMGNAHNFSIAGRASIGPTFFGVDLSQVIDASSGDPIRTVEYLNYPRSSDKGLFVTKYSQEIDDISSDWNSTDRVTYRDMHYNLRIRPHRTEFPPSHIDFPDQDSETLGNDIWTVSTRAGIGFIIPGTRTYAVFGKAAGMDHGLGYRIKNDIGREMSGPAPYVNTDRYNFHWLYDMRDIIDSVNGLRDPWDILPYAYGRISLPFERQPKGSSVEDAGHIFGGTFDPDNMRMYLAIRAFDGSKPLILAYDISL